MFSHLYPSVVVLNLVSNLFLVGSSAAPEQCSDTESVVLGADHLPPPHPVHAGQVLLVHDVLLDALAGTCLVRSFQPGETKCSVRFIIRHSELHLL